MDGKMPLSQAIPLGLQHVLAMFVGNLTPLLIITGACGWQAESLHSCSFPCCRMHAGSRYCNAGTVVSIGPVGGKVPIIMGTSFRIYRGI